MKRYSIYTLAHPITLEVVYVGQTSLLLNDRLVKHYEASKLRNSKIYQWMRILQEDNLIPVIELLEEVTKESMDSSEIYWISQLRSLGFSLLNQTDGGKGSNGFKHTQESKNKVSKANIGNTKRFNVEHTEETKQKLREANLGKTLSEDTKAKMSATTKNKIGGNDTRVIDESTGIEYPTIKACADALGINKSTLRLRIKNNQGVVKLIEQPQYREPKVRVRNHKNQVIDITTGITYESGKEAAKALSLNYNTLKKNIRKSIGNIITIEEFNKVENN